MVRTTFWGVRGSIPAPGPRTARIGGNTSCVEVRGRHQRLVFDAGTGVRALGRALAAEMPVTVHLFFSHLHWDHIHGFPFFAPAFSKENRLRLYGAPEVYGSLEQALARQMAPPHFPVPFDSLPSDVSFHAVSDGGETSIDDTTRVSTARGRHPGGVCAYRAEIDGRVVVYATDTEHPSEGVDNDLVALARGADVLIYDAQYTPEEYEGQKDVSRVGWGHSTFVAAAELARSADVGQLVLFHHDPDQDDEAVAEKERRARALFGSTRAAYEGLTLEL